ncbi:M48 family metallopeptidase [Halosquirtibacter xylanolyticus]|uniref:M48 family metallopeptidase n=1 Tax=Halosquirtibacter xylanolyticus TaxID=3374599 RepID=UPI0037483F21|nr:M48 family metallopeptidase [Prolixibacteraceae bacterium]
MSEKIAWQCGGREVSVEVIRGNRKHAGLEVEVSGVVRLKVPEKASIEQVERLLEKKRDWLRKQLNELVDQPMPPSVKRYVSGECFMLYGKSLRLKVKPINFEMVKLEGGYLTLYLGKEATKARAAQLVDRWYLNRAKKDIRPMFEEQWKRCCRTLATNKEVTMEFRKMERRWGSCSVEGKILLNPSLVQAPLHCIRYVIVHELCHVKYHHHGPQFYALLDRLLPDWRVSKNELDRMEF